MTLKQREKALAKENRKLAVAHGEVRGMPFYRWCWAEDLRYPSRVEGKWDYRATESGIIQAVPVFQFRQMAPWLSKQYVLCVYLASPTEQEWKSRYGLLIDYPGPGYYAPTNIELDPGINPWDSDTGHVTLTDMVTKMISLERQKTDADYKAEGEDIILRQEKAQESKLSDMIDDLTFAFSNTDHIPGKRGGGISFGGIEKGN